jgi:hypothetical protein
MVGRSPIFSAKVHSKQIGYTEDGHAFDLLGHKRCNYSPNTGNLRDLDSGSIIGHLSLAGRFVGLSCVAEELFPEPSPAKPKARSSEAATGFAVPTAASRRSPDGSNAPAIFLAEPAAASCAALASCLSLVDSVASAALSRDTSSDDAIAPATSFTGLAAPDCEALAPRRDEPAVIDSAARTAVSHESSPHDSIAPTTSFTGLAAPDCEALAPRRDEPTVVDSAVRPAASHQSSPDDSIAPAASFTVLAAPDCEAFAPRRDEPAVLDSAARPTASHESFPQDSIAPAASSTKRAAADCAALSASSVSIAHDSPAATTSTNGPVDFTALTASSGKPPIARRTEVVPIDVEKQILEIIRVASTMKGVEPRRNVVKDIATQMRERIAVLRRKRLQTRAIHRVS